MEHLLKNRRLYILFTLLLWSCNKNELNIEIDESIRKNIKIVMSDKEGREKIIYENSRKGTLPEFPYVNYWSFFYKDSLIYKGGAFTFMGDSDKKPYGCDISIKKLHNEYIIHIETKNLYQNINDDVKFRIKE